MNRSVRCSLFLVAALTLVLGLSGCVANRAYREMPPVPHAPTPAPGEEALCPEAPVSPPQATAAKGATKGSREIGPVLHEQVTDKETDTVYKYSLAFVEFDDLGEMFYRPTEICKDGQGNRHGYYTELGQTLTEIKRLNDGGEGLHPVFVLFIPGWKNNASESSGNVWGFRSALQSLARKYHGKLAIMGIYIGWRGAATNVPVAKEFSFWNRKNAATRIPGAHLTEAIRRITMEAKRNSNAKLVVVGHSFGGLVMERTLTQAMVEMILEYREENDRIDREVAEGKLDKEATARERQNAADKLQSRMPDLTVLLNEAGPATESKEFLNFLYREQITYANKDGDHPLILSLTSTGDWATHIFFPVGQFLGKKSLNTRKYDEEDEFGEKDQNNYFLHTTANSQRLTNHTIESADSAEPPKCAHPYGEPFTLYDARFFNAARGEKPVRDAKLRSKTYRICNDDNAKNDTPYWAMQIPTEFVPDHSTVFKPELRALLEAFLRPHLGLPAAPPIGPAGVVPPPPPPPPSPITLQRKPASK